MNFMIKENIRQTHDMPRVEGGVKNRPARHISIIAAILANILLNNFIFYLILGIFNRFGFLKVVFVAYPITKKYAEAYTYQFTRPFIKWYPYLVGLYNQDGNWGLMFVISSVEGDFNNRKNNWKLKFLVFNMNVIRILVGAKKDRYAGILEGVLYKRQIKKTKVGLKVAVDSIAGACKKVVNRTGYSDDTTIILLGGKGFVGRDLPGALQTVGLTGDLICVDAKNGDTKNANLDEWPSFLDGEKVILINLTNKNTLELYANLFWEELILINEAYGDLRGAVAKITNNGAMAFHIIGIKAKSYPSIPGPYKYGVPLCGAYSSGEVMLLCMNDQAKKLIKGKAF